MSCRALTTFSVGWTHGVQMALRKVVSWTKTGTQNKIRCQGHAPNVILKLSGKNTRSVKSKLWKLTRHVLLFPRRQQIALTNVFDFGAKLTSAQKVLGSSIQTVCDAPKAGLHRKYGGDIEDITCLRVDMNFIFECSTGYHNEWAERTSEINILTTMFFTSYRRFPTTFQRFPKIFQNGSEGLTNFSKHFPKIAQDIQR